jgi:hypothetical protein
VVGGRRISGAVEDSEKAFEMYDDALARGDGAFLLDQERPNISTLSVGSLPAGAEAVVEIEYVALLDQRGREVTLVRKREEAIVGGWRLVSREFPQRFLRDAVGLLGTDSWRGLGTAAFGRIGRGD